MILILVMLVWTACMVPAEAQFGGTKTVADTQTVSQKFHVFRLKDGQRFETPEGTVDTLKATVELTLPLVNPKPPCDANAKGVLLTDTSDNRAYFCNGSAWKIIAYDADVDGLTDLIDANEAVPFTAGTGVAGEVLSGATVYSGAGMIYTTGTMPNQAAWSSNPASGNTAIPAGYHNGSGVVYGDGDFVAANIRAGSDLWGTVGTYPSSSNRLPGDDGTPNGTAGQVLAGFELWDSDGVNLAGTMPNQGTVYFTPSASNQSIPVGYHSGSGVVYGDANLTGINIKTGVSIFGVSGALAVAPPGCDGGSASPRAWGDNTTDHCDNDHDGLADEQETNTVTITPMVGGYFLGDNTASKNRRCYEGAGSSYSFYSWPNGANWGTCAWWNGSSWSYSNGNCLWGDNGLVCTSGQTRRN